jgi:hypothetical protein
MRKFLIAVCAVMTLVACSSDKKKIQHYLDNNFSDREIVIDGDVVTDSAFCPLAELENVSLQLTALQGQLLQLLDVNPDSAFSLAASLQQKYSQKDAFVNMAYPKGKNNRLSYRAKCICDGAERYVTFFKYPQSDEIETSSLEVDENVDSLMVTFNQLMNGVKVIMDDRGGE